MTYFEETVFGLRKLLRCSLNGTFLLSLYEKVTMVGAIGPACPNFFGDRTLQGYVDVARIFDWGVGRKRQLTLDDVIKNV